jgi:hypothetical protein
MLIITACTTSVTKTTFLVVNSEGNGSWKEKQPSLYISNTLYKLTLHGAIYVAATVCLLIE